MGGACLAHSLQNFHHMILCAALCFASCAQGGLAAGSVALALYVCPYTPIVLILPCAYLSYLHRNKADEAIVDGYRYVRSKDIAVIDWAFVGYLVKFTVVVVLLFVFLIGGSIAAMGGNASFLYASYASVLSVADLTPNVGIFWYIFIEVFDRYRALFLITFHAHLLFYPIPLHLRVGRHGPVGPWIHCFASLGIITLFKPYPTASDYCLMLSVLVIQVELIRECEKQFAFLLSGTMFGLSMFPTMSAVWLTRNAGNANFLYNMTLVINVFGCLLLSDWVKAGMKLRRRQHMGAFCRGIVLDTLEEMLSKHTSPVAESGDTKAETMDTSGTATTGPRKRR